ncbi:hypothetical protein CKC_00910 [Candidatus Liberibacter solanacearum CLso-ZC1]|uniref:Uncharacterized protein n=1 Tax=Liberibacter solanacearum (strain CLso-ZC1) TaxID=658172 RepID=E4UC43_LIBSC|nr:hypothetical protein [Candidatus Liberibacter solanacearum]ADR51933.1 hypothetical protein CKC_00910 [Candidatus Liberibacter solanacearum CLso-ZC1]
MGWFKKALKWTVAVAGSVVTGVALATGVGAPVAAAVATWTVTMTTILDADIAEEDDRAKRAEELKESTENANASKDLNNILDQARADTQKSQAIRDKEEITAEDLKDALEHLSQAYIKVAGIGLSVNSQKNDPEIIKGIKDVIDRVSQERIAWRAKLHDDYKVDMATTHVDLAEKKKTLNSLYDKVVGYGEEAQALRTDLKTVIDFLDSKVAPEHQEFVDERRKEVEALKSLKREHEEAFNKAKESVKNNAVSGVEDAERALEKRAEFDSKFKELLDVLRSKQADLPHVLTLDIQASIVDFYGVFRDPELLHNEVFATAYKQQAERNEQVVFATPLDANAKATWHLKRSKDLYEIYKSHIKNKEYALARKLRFQVEAHQREATRIAEQLPAKFSVWKSGKVKDWVSEFKRLFKKYSNLKNLEDWGKSLKDQINAHGDEIHKAMHLADLGEDDFYRMGLKATVPYFVVNKQISDGISTLIEETESKIPTLDARERAKAEEARLKAEEARLKAEETRLKAEDARVAEEARLKEEARVAEEARLKAEELNPQEPALQAPLQDGTEGQASETEQQAKEETETNVSEDVYHNSYPTSSTPMGELSAQAEKTPVLVEETNFTPLTPAQKAEKKAEKKSEKEAEEERKGIINAQYRRDVKANIARQEARSKRDRERWSKLSKEEISKKFNLIYELFSTKAVSTPELLFDGDLTVLDNLTMDEVVDQEKWKEITDAWEGMELSPKDKWESLSFILSGKRFLPMIRDTVAFIPF